MRDLPTFLATWVIAFAVTFFIVNASLLFWARIRWHEAHRAHLAPLASDVQSAPDLATKNHVRTRYWMRRAVMEYPFCPICVGLLAQIAAVLVAWAEVGFPAQILGVRAWLALPAFVSAQWLTALALGRLLPDVGMLPDYHNVEEP